MQIRIVAKTLVQQSAFKLLTISFSLLFFLSIPNVVELRDFSVFTQSELFANPISKKKPAVRNGMNFLAPVSIELKDVELLRFLERYSELYEFHFFMDRRVDPSILVSGSYTDAPFISALADILKKVNLGYCVVDNVFLYIGPQDAVGEALLLLYLKRDQLFEDFPKQVAEKLSSTIDFEISPFSEPQVVFQSLAKQTRLKFAGFDKTPFDLWRGTVFERITVADVLTILTIGFNVDYAYDSDSSSIKPTSIDRRQKVMRYYPKETADQIKKKNHPNCSFHEANYGNEPAICVAGFFEDVAPVEYEYFQICQENLSEKAKPFHSTESVKPTWNSKATSSSSNRSTHVEITGTVSNKTLNDLFAYLKKNSKITCKLDPSLASSGVTLDTRVTCEFNHSDVEDIASIIASQIKAKATVADGTIVFSKK